MTQLKYWYHSLLAFALLAGPSLVSAQDKGIILNGQKPDVANGSFGNMADIIRNGFNIVIGVAGVLFVLLFLVGGVMYLTAAGNDDQSKKAKQLLFDAVIGLVIVVVAWAVGNWVLQLLGITVKVTG